MQEKNIIMTEDIELGIDPYPLNETESRLITLLFNLLKYPSGLTYDSIRLYMKEHYNNDKIDSDQKKLHRDMEELGKLGFPAYVRKEDNTYHVKFQINETKFKFSKEELQAISQSLIHQIPEDKITPDVYSLAQKIFGSEWNLYPEWNLNFTKTLKDFEQKDSETIIETLLFCIKNKIPVRISYERRIGLPESKDLDVIQLIKKNSSDFYLYAYDRTKKDYRNYLIPCIQKIYKLESSFIKDHKPSLSFENLHPLMIPKNPDTKIEVTIQINHIDNWENFISGLTYEKDRNNYVLTIRNLESFYTYLLKHGSYFISLQPSSISKTYLEFLDKIESSHALA